MRLRRSRLDRLEDDVLNESRPLAPTLRQVIALGGHAHSEPLRTWALRELQDYEGTDVPIPDYRRISAPLVMDGLAGMFQFREQPVSTFDLPDFARESLGDVLRLGQGVGQIESLLARQPDQTVQLAQAMAAELAAFMSQNSSRQVLRPYLAVHPSAMEGSWTRSVLGWSRWSGNCGPPCLTASRTQHRTRSLRHSRTSTSSQATTPP
ncbi:hypothetical protein C9J60_32505 [Streptomyces sp. A244]|nr:hypothetical protein C9J60_32505 [Streptomyces sp. A244]